MEIRVETTPIPGLVIVEHEVFEDARGFFLEAFRADLFAEHGLPTSFLQLNHSRSERGVVRGLHFQWDRPMGKLMRVTCGEALLAAVDIRPGSPTLGRSHLVEASAANKRQVWAPPGFARGFCVLSEAAEIQYLCTAIYNPRGESGIRWDDPDIGIDWPVDDPVLSAKDREAQSLAAWLARPEAETFRWEPGG